jgi:hypothetical protein
VSKRISSLIQVKLTKIKGETIMKMSKNFKQLKVLLLLFVVLLFLSTGCEKSTTDPGAGEFELSQPVMEGLVSSCQTIDSVNSVGEASEMVSGNLDLEETDLGGIYNLSDLQKEYNGLQPDLAEAARGMSLKSKNPEMITGDSLIWFIDWTNPITGVSVRKALVYNTTTGRARYYEAKYQFPALVKLVYDSTEIQVDLNFTLDNESDDKFLSLSKLSIFKVGTFIEKIESEAAATDWDDNNEVTGATLSNNVFYGAQTKLLKLTQELEINPDQSGYGNERLDYRDGTYLARSITLNNDCTGSYSATWRNGTHVYGTFDLLEDDNHAQLTRTVDFPSGFFLDKIEQLADFTLDPVDSSTQALLNEKKYFTSGRLDTSQLEIEEYFEDGIKNTYLIGAHSNGSKFALFIKDYKEYQKVDGNFVGPLGHYNLIEAILYTDGSGELWLTVYENEQAYDNGESPIAVIYIHFNPDGSGDGKITEGLKEYTVTVEENGEMTVINDQGKRQKVSGF